MRRIELKVITRAKKEAIERVSHDSYRIKVSRPPEKGRANKRVIELVSKELGIRKHNIKIVSGETKNRKIVEIDV